MKKMFSIITATFNAAEKISKTIESIVSQNRNLYEYIIIDGKSTDGTVEIIQHYQNKYKDNIRYVSEPDTGVYDGLNKGISLAKGEYLYFIGAGDTLFPNVLEKVSKYLSFSLELVYGNVFLKADQKVVKRKFNKDRISVQTLCHQAIFYKKEIFDILGNYNLKYSISADHIFNIKCFGVDEINKKYIDVLIATYEQGGISSFIKDPSFALDLENVIHKELGEEYLERYRYSGRKLEDFIRNFDSQNIAIISDHMIILNSILYNINYANEYMNRNITIKNIYSNDPLFCGQVIYGLLVKNLDLKELEEVDKVIIGSRRYKEVEKQLGYNGYYKDKIIIGSELLYTKAFNEFCSEYDRSNVIIFGVGEGGKKVYNYLIEKIPHIKIKSFFDNNSDKWHDKFF
ncbi:MAG: glycosyltransferase, partial [Tissierellia bacterium]|nr:glycosyltransferase [Tissierellia bacterium]